MKDKKIICYLGIATALILGAVGWFVLPDTVAMKFGLDGTVKSTSPKLQAILIPVIISAAGGISGIVTDKDNRVRAITAMAIGIVIMAVMIVMNLK